LVREVNGHKAEQAAFLASGSATNVMLNGAKVAAAAVSDWPPSAGSWSRAVKTSGSPLSSTVRLSSFGDDSV